MAGTATQTLGDAGKIYDVSFLQFYQGDQIRGVGWTSEAETPREGRRVLAQQMHDPAARNPAVAGAPAGGVRIATDGSMAAFVPARRALSWQMTAADGEPVVRERYWLTFQPGEIRTCTSCHGLNTRDQADRPTPQNKPEALRALIRHWKTLPGNGNPLRIYAQERLQDGRFQVHVTGVPQQSYVLQFSVQLPQWLPLATNVAQNGLVDFIDTEAPSSSRRFYRAVQP